MPTINHVILTRFNLPSLGLESHVRAREGWLRGRVDLFERYCAPSVANQTRPDLDWLVYFDPESPDWLVERMRPFVERGLFRPVYRAAVSTAELVSDLRETVEHKGDILITTNLDNDDGLAADFSERIRAVATDAPRAALYVTTGLIKSEAGVYLRTDRRNAFVSVRESWESPVGAWSEYHNEYHRIMPTVEVDGPPGWLQVVHGSNVSNRVRGRLVAPGAYRSLFDGLLDDAEQPSLLALGQDRLLRQPARAARDGFRAGARRLGLRLLGKDGYSQAKLRLASLAPSRHPSVVVQTHVVIIVQNLPVPLDRRVWLECQALTDRGYEVSVICPKGPGDPNYEVIDGVHIYKYRPAPQAQGLPGYAVEFGYSWLQTARLSLKVWRRRPFQVMQACNPPDTYWALARLWRARGVRFVFDHHDLNPELFLSRFGQPKSGAQRLQYRGLLWLERMTFRTADRVTSTNESYKSVAVRRGDRRPEDVTVVRSCPDTRTMRPIYSDLASQKPARFVLAYLGIMGPQDGVETVLDVMEELVHKRGREDVHAWLLGFGDCYEDLRRRCTELDLDQVVTFTGRADKGMIADYLSVADVGVGPDLKTPLNDLSTMNKTMEYMAYCLPCVSFDLLETRVTGGDSVLYAETGDVPGFADQVERLLDDPDLRLRLGLQGRRRVATELDWSAQARGYVSVFDELTGTQRPAAAPDGGTPDELDPRGKRYLDLTDEAELSRFIVERSSLPAPVAADASNA